jgi:uncharacterized protein (TIGR02246 family)
MRSRSARSVGVLGSALGRVLLVIGFLLPACGGGPVRTAELWARDGARTADTALVRELLSALETAVADADLEAVVAQYTLDASWQPPGEALLRGRDAIEERYATLFGVFEVELGVTVDRIVVDGDAGQVDGRTSTTLTPRAGGEPARRDHKFRMVLNRDLGGDWLIRHLEWRAWEPLAEPSPEAEVVEAPSSAPGS